MKKFLFHSGVFLRAIANQRLLLMFKWVFIFIFACCMRVSASGYAQNTRVSFDIRNMEFKKVLFLLQRKSKIHLLYSNELLPAGKTISLTVKEELVLSVLQKLLANTGLQYKVLNDELVVIVTEGAEVRNTLVKGRITDDSGKPMAGVTVQIEGASNGVSSNADGEYAISVPEKGRLVFSYVGYMSETVTVNGKERARELVGEENRRMTLMRTGTLVTRTMELNGSSALNPVTGLAAKHLLMPIPQSEIDLNKDAKLEQNPGY